MRHAPAGMLVVPPEEPVRHYCSAALPFPYQYVGGTLARCTCSRWFRAYGGAHALYWTPVRWWHFRLRARVSELERAERARHNDRDSACRFWWGDRSGSVVGAMHERCEVCNPAGA